MAILFKRFYTSKRPRRGGAKGGGGCNRKLHVRFSDKDQVKQPEVGVYYETDHADIWLTRKESSEIRSRDFNITKMLQRYDWNEVETRQDESLRGMEYAEAEQGIAMKHRRRNSISAALSTQQLLVQKQQLQKKKRNSDDSSWEAIARVYGLICIGALQNAIERAADDEKFVNDHVRDVPVGQPQTPTRTKDLHEQRQEGCMIAPALSSTRAPCISASPTRGMVRIQ